MLARKVKYGDWRAIDMAVFRQLKRTANSLGIAFIRNPFTSKYSIRVFCRTMSMKAVVVEEFGDSSKLKYLEVTKPDPAEGEVLKILIIFFYIFVHVKWLGGGWEVGRGQRKGKIQDTERFSPFPLPFFNRVRVRARPVLNRGVQKPKSHSLESERCRFSFWLSQFLLQETQPVRQRVGYSTQV